VGLVIVRWTDYVPGFSGMAGWMWEGERCEGDVRERCERQICEGEM
jgi:hypothetical protein